MFNGTAALTRSSRIIAEIKGEVRNMPGEQNYEFGFLENSLCKAQTVMVITVDA
jgi:hypothetical protein